MVADIEVRWRGRRWLFESIAIDVSTEVDIITRQYSPRRIEFDVPLGDTMGRWLAGDSWETIAVQVTVGGKVYSTSPVISITAGVNLGEQSRMTTIVVSDKPAESSPCPPVTDITLRSADVQATADALAAEQAAWTIADARRGPDGMVNGSDISVQAMDSTYPTKVTNLYNVKVQGLALPIPFGRPGSDSTPAYRAIQVDDSHRRLIIAAFPISGTVSLQKSGYDTWYSYTVETYTVNGRDLAVVAIPTFPGITDDQKYDPGAAFYVAFDGTAKGLSGDAVDVCVWLLSRTGGVRADYASWASVRGRLAGYRFDACLDQSGDAWQILSGDILPLLPIQLIPTPYGIGAKWLDLDPVYSQRTKRAILGVTMEPVDGAVAKFDDTQATTSVVVGFNPNALASGYGSTVIANARNIGKSRRAMSQAAGKQRKVDTPWVRDRSVAQTIARDMVLAGCMRFARFDVDADPFTHGDEGTRPIHAGDIVTLYGESGTATALAMALVEKRSGMNLTYTLGMIQQ